MCEIVKIVKVVKVVIVTVFSLYQKTTNKKMVKVGGWLVWCTGYYNSNYINQWGVGLSF